MELQSHFPNQAHAIRCALADRDGVVEQTIEKLFYDVDPTRTDTRRIRRAKKMPIPMLPPDMRILDIDDVWADANTVQSDSDEAIFSMSV